MRTIMYNRITNGSKIRLAIAALGVIIGICGFLEISYAAPHQGITLPEYAVEFLLRKAKVSDVKVIDYYNPSRYSDKNSGNRLEMASTGGASRRANVLAIRDKDNLSWDEGEPIWTGLRSAQGVESMHFLVEIDKVPRFYSSYPKGA